MRRLTAFLLFTLLAAAQGQAFRDIDFGVSCAEFKALITNHPDVFLIDHDQPCGKQAKQQLDLLPGTTTMQGSFNSADSLVHVQFHFKEDTLVAFNIVSGERPIVDMLLAIFSPFDECDSRPLRTCRRTTEVAYIVWQSFPSPLIASLTAYDRHALRRSSGL